MNKPNPIKIRQARIQSGLTQKAAADLVHVTLNAWQKWESGERPINMAAWELFLIKVDKINICFVLTKRNKSLY